MSNYQPVTGQHLYEMVRDSGQNTRSARALLKILSGSRQAEFKARKVETKTMVEIYKRRASRLSDVGHVSRDLLQLSADLAAVMDEWLRMVTVGKEENGGGVWLREDLSAVVACYTGRE